MRLSFWKMDGAGNDFVLVEKKGSPALARRLCDRKRGVGADGLLVVDRRKPELTYYNADGSKAFCGNGSRCAAIWLKRIAGFSGNEIKFRSAAGELSARILGPCRAAVRMPTPRLIKAHGGLSAAGRRWDAQHWISGVPHAVVPVEDLATVDVRAFGGPLRRHAAFGKKGANVDFIQRIGRRVAVRTFERGVEDETLACGTGVVAAAAAAERLGWGSLPMKVRVQSGDTLTVARAGAHLWLEGPARFAFTGEIEL